ncbi:MULTISPECIES: hypothetical protein [unclassified Kitasatospora]|uniref:hypothetical protein n=1 Tax=unclassified Kitasatospora TaxID=2633591 RepID=UPI0033E12C8F
MTGQAGLLDLEAEAFAEVAAAVRAGRTLTAEHLQRLAGWAGRLNVPALLHDAWFGRAVTAAVLARYIGHAWSAAEFPDRSLPRESWRQMFRAAGYTRDGVPAPLPPGPVELWRGSVPVRRRDWSWTATRAVAQRYADGAVAGRPPGRLYRVVAPTGALLSHSTSCNEDEYVIDTRGLQIAEASPVAPPRAG